MTPSDMVAGGPERARLEALLREHGAGEDALGLEVEALAALASWRAPVPTKAETGQLIRRLAPLLPAQAATRSRPAPPGALAGEWRDIMGLVAAQVSILRPAFWLSSVLVTLLGVLAIHSVALPPALVVSICGPLLSYLGTASAFRGMALGMVEFELACPPSIRQITLARLVLILSYDTGLALAGSGLLRLWGGAAPLALTFQWLAPLLLVAGLTLALSLRFAVAKAAAFSYVAWLVYLAPRWLAFGPGSSGAFGAGLESVFAAAGLALLAIAVVTAPAANARLLPHH